MEAFEKWLREKKFPHLKILGGVQWDYCNDAWKASREELLKEIDKRFVSIIKLCDHIASGKKDIRQVANDACSFIYLIQKELGNE
jgi:hypothetical protein